MNSSGTIEYIFTERSEILTDKLSRVDMCVIKDQIYAYDNHMAQKNTTPEEFCELKPNFQELMESKSQYEIEEQGVTTSSIGLNFNKLKQELFLNENDQNKFYFMLSLLLCNPHIVDSETKSINNNDNAIVDFLKIFEFVMISRTYKDCKIRFQNVVYDYDILQNYQVKSHTCTTVVRNILTNEAVLLYRGPKRLISTLISKLKTEDLSSLKFERLQNTEKLHYGYKILTDENIEKLNFDIKQAVLSPLNSKGRIKLIFEKLAKNINYLGFISIKSSISADTKETIQSFSDAGIKI